MPLTPTQTMVADDENRFKVVCAGRRWGKSWLSIREMCRYASQPNKKVYYVAPTFRQAKTIIWDDLISKLSAVRWIKKINTTELTVRLKNGSTIALRSADNYESLRGISIDYLVMDECSDIEVACWSEVLRPALADRKGHALFISTPKGYNWFYDLWAGAPAQDNWQSFQFTTLEGGNVPEDEVESAKSELDPRTFEQEFLASFVNFSGVVYYAFERDRNVKDLPAQLDIRDVLHIGVDFNTQPMSAVVANWDGLTMHVFDEIEIRNSNTYELCEEISKRYPKSRVIAYPDASGANQKTSAMNTDHNILRQYNFTVKSARVNPPVIDRIASVNTAFYNKTGETRLTVGPKCKSLIRCLDKQTYKEGTRQPDKSAGLDHMPDALGYLVWGVMPIRRPTQHSKGPELFAHY
tara:strand:+ start:493 stop:1719 length:1227 start_codon:yes stop_codon:yes gene_type:complete